MIYPLFFLKRRNIPKGRVAEIDIDIASHKKERAFEVVQRKLRALGGDIVRVGTFGTESSKSAIQTACRGLGIEKEIYQHLSNLIPIHRGNPRGLHECYYGSEEHEPIHEFKRICDEYAHLNLIQIALRIEGLINKRSVHSCGIVITNRHITNYNCRAITPGGEFVTMWDLGDTEQCGLIKYDHLVTKNVSMIQICLEKLLEAGYIEWKGSLRKTYLHYLEPKRLDLTTKEMYHQLNRGDVLGAFQFDSQSGEAILAKTKPETLLEVATANTLMRLMVEEEGLEQPSDLYVRYKANINEWYEDMRAFGLNEAEIKILEDHLLPDYGVMNTQEQMMMMVMDEHISNFDVVGANKLRKAVAKLFGVSSGNI